MMRIIHKSSVDGRIVSKVYALANPDTTYAMELDDDELALEALRPLVEMVTRESPVMLEHEHEAFELARSLLD